MKKILTLIALVFLFSCNTQKTKYPKWNIFNPVTGLGDNHLFANVKGRDGRWYPTIVLARIYKWSKVDSAHDKAVLVTDTAWGYPVTQYIIDSVTKKPVIDSTGLPKINDKSPYISIGKDSIIWQNIEGVPLELFNDNIKNGQRK